MQLSEVSLHVGCTSRWDGTVVVQENFVSVFATLPRKLCGSGSADAFEVHGDWMFFVLHELSREKPDWFVLSIENDISAILLFAEAIRHEDRTKITEWHSGSFG